MLPREVFLCAICNISSGSCSEDCAFCTQSAHYHADIELYKQKPLEKIVAEARKAHEHQALGFCLVSAGRGLDDRTLRFVCESAEAIKCEIPNLNLIACNGLASKFQLQILKDHGIFSYNHNLESSENYYTKICSTHTWRSRYETCEAVKEVGLELCCGGIFGMGECEEDRYDLVDAITSLSPSSVTVNFFHPNPVLPLQKNLDTDAAIFWINSLRENLSESMIMVAGGRELIFESKEREMFEAGANAIVIGDYLTTSGNAVNQDLQMIDKLGLKVARHCER